MTALLDLASVRSTRATAANHRQLISACRRDELGVANSNVTSEVTGQACPRHSACPRLAVVRPARATAKSRVRSVRPLDRAVLTTWETAHPSGAKACMRTPMLGRSGLPRRSELQSGHPSPWSHRPEARFSFHPSGLIALIALLARLKFGEPSPRTVSVE
jgi:hypothetical protein